VRALYARLVAKHPGHKAVAVGHAMRKLLHLVFALRKSGRPFDPRHYPWSAPSHAEVSDNTMSQAEQAAGHKPDVAPAASVVAAACEDSVAEPPAGGEGGYGDLAHLKRQLPLARVLEPLGLAGRLRGRGPQRRGACPLHRGDARGRTFSVNLDENVFHCFDRQCGQRGDAIDLWAAVHGWSLRQAALDLVQTFGLEPAPQRGTEKRHG
jgi:CHC2 zinc finger